MKPARVEISSVCEQTVSQNQPFQHLSQQQKSNTLRYDTQRETGKSSGRQCGSSNQGPAEETGQAPSGAMLGGRENVSSSSSAGGTENHLTQIAHPGKLHLGLDGV